MKALNQRWIAYIFYFFVYFQSGILMGFMPLFLAGKGYSIQEFGVISSVAILSRLLLNPLIGWFATKHLEIAFTIFMLSCFSAISFVFISMGSKDEITILFLIANIVCLPIRPLGDAQIISWNKSGGTNYSTLRIWGSIAFLIAFIIGEKIIDSIGLTAVPLIAAISYLIVGLVFLFQVNKSFTPQRKPKITVNMISIFKDKTIMCAAFCQASHGVFYAYSSLLWIKSGFNLSEIALIWSLGIVSEICMFYWLSKFKIRIKEEKIILICLAAVSIRWLGIGLFSDIEIIFGIQILQALTIALMQNTLSSIWHKKETEGDVVYAITIYDAVTYGGLQAMLVYIASFYSLSNAFLMVGTLTSIIMFYLLISIIKIKNKSLEEG